MGRKDEQERERKGAVPWFWGGSGRRGVELLGTALRARPALVGAARGSGGLLGSLLSRIGGSALSSALNGRALAAGLTALVTAAALGAVFWGGFSSGKEGRRTGWGAFGSSGASPRPDVRDPRASSSLGMVQSANAGALSFGAQGSAGDAEQTFPPAAEGDVPAPDAGKEAGKEPSPEDAAGAVERAAAEAAGSQGGTQAGLVPVPSMSARGGAGGLSGAGGSVGGGGSPQDASGAAAGHERPKPVLTASRQLPQAVRDGSQLSTRNALDQLRAGDRFSRAAAGTGGEGASYTAAVPFDGGVAARGGAPSGLSGGGWAGSAPGPSSSGGPFLQERPGTLGLPSGGGSGSSGGLAGKNVTPYQTWVNLAVGLLAASALLLLIAVMLSRTVFGASWAVPLARVTAVLAAGAAAAGAYIMSQGQHLQGAVFTMAGAALAFLSWTAPLGDPSAAQGGQAAAGAAAAPAAQATDKLDASGLSLFPEGQAPRVAISPNMADIAARLPPGG